QAEDGIRDFHVTGVQTCALPICGAIDTRHQTQEAQHRERQGRIHVQLLRHVADAQARLALYAAPVGLEQAEHGAHQGGLAGAVGADQGHDLAGTNSQPDILQHRLAGEADADTVQMDQYILHCAPWQPEQSPTTSTVWFSTAKPTCAAPATMAWLMLACSSSTAVLQLRQMRNWPWCRVPGWAQPMKALSEAMRCTRPFAWRKSSARYTVGGAARRPSSSLSTARMS